MYMGDYNILNFQKISDTTGTSDTASSTQKKKKLDPIFNYVLKDTGNGSTPQDIPRQEQEEALLYLERMIKGSNEIVTEREKEAGAISWTVNAWLEILNSEDSKSNTKKNIKDTEKDFNKLKQAADGELYEYNLLTPQEEPQTFKDTFKKTRGVEYNKENIDDCLEKADKYAQVKMRTEMIREAKSMLFGSTKGDVQSQMNSETSNAAILKTLKMCGLNKKSDVDKFLSDFCEKHKDDPEIKKYGGNFKLFKNKQGQYEIYRTSKSGSNELATNEQLRMIAEELSGNLDREYAKALGVEIPENATNEELAEITQNVYDKHKQEYEKAFTKAFGKKDIKVLSEKFAQTQAQGVEYVKLGVNMLSMATMILPTGAVGAASMALKGAQATGKGVQVATKAVKVAQTVEKGTKAISPVLMANVVLNPVELIEQLTSENGMSEKEWEEWGKGVLENSIYMGLGMGASQVAAKGAAMYKTRALVKTLQQTGKSADEIATMISANPVKFPEEIVKSMKSIDKVAKSLQISTETALDLSSTYLANQVMGNGDLKSMDWIMSVGTALMGGTIQKQFAPLTTEAKVKYLKDAFKDLKITDDIAMNILKTMDDISAGKIDAKTGAKVLPEVEVTASATAATKAKAANDNIPAAPKPQETAVGTKKAYQAPETGTKSYTAEKSVMADSTPKAEESNLTNKNKDVIDSNKENVDLDKLFGKFELDWTPTTHEKIYQTTAPGLIKSGFSEATLKNLSTNALRQLDLTHGNILYRPDGIDQILKGIEDSAGKEVRDEVFGALKSNPEFKSIIIEKAKGQAKNMGQSTNNVNIEDTAIKKALSQVETFEELNALENRLNGFIEVYVKNDTELRPKYDALKEELRTKKQELVSQKAEADAKVIAEIEAHTDHIAKERAAEEKDLTSRDYKNALIDNFGYTEKYLDGLNKKQFEKISDLCDELTRIKSKYTSYEPSKVSFFGDILPFKELNNPAAENAVGALISNPEFRNIIMSYENTTKYLDIPEGYVAEIPAARKTPNYIQKEPAATNKNNLFGNWINDMNSTHKQRAEDLIGRGFNRNIIENLNPEEFDILYDIIRKIDTERRENNVDFQRNKEIDEACAKFDEDVNIDPILEKFNVDEGTREKIKTKKTQQTTAEKNNLVSALSSRYKHIIKAEDLESLNITQLREFDDYLIKIEKEADDYLFTDTKIEHARRVEEILAGCTDDTVRNLLRRSYLRHS